MSPPTKPTTGIDDLPPEMISELFEYLPLKDLAACSLVNKRWNSIYAAFKVHMLAVTDYPDYGLVHWYSSSRRKEEGDQCHLAMFGRLTEKPLLSNLKYLALCDSSSEFDLNELNRFSQLVHLEMDMPRFGESVHLNLPRLKVLAFQEFFNEDCSLSIDCPRLSTLLYHTERENVNLLEVKSPETIRKLETNMINPKWLAPFKSVECLVTWKSEAISKATLLSLPRLRELRCNSDIDNLFREISNHEPGRVDRVKRKLSEFLDEAKELRGSDFRFGFAGLQLANVNVDQIDFGVQIDARYGRERVSNESAYMKNYQLIEPGAIDFVHRVYYTRLMNNMTGEFPRCFSQKFTDIKEVFGKAEVQDADHFLWFLKSLRSLRTLWLESTGLTQEFYNQLPASAHSLIYLHLREGHCKDGLQLNFDFIRKLSCLSLLQIWPALSLESATSLVRWLGGLKNCSFQVQSEESVIEIRKFERPAWKIVNDGKLLFEAANTDELVNYFDRIQ